MKVVKRQFITRRNKCCKGKIARLIVRGGKAVWVCACGKIK